MRGSASSASTSGNSVVPGFAKQTSMPPSAAYDGVVFLTPEQQAKAGAAIAESWGAKVGAEVTR